MAGLDEFMGNRTAVGVVAVLLLLFAVSIFFYNRALDDLAAGSCTEDVSVCPHAKVVETQNAIIAALVLVIAVMAGWLAYSAYSKPPAEKDGPARPAPRQAKRRITAELGPDETAVAAVVNAAGGSAYQSDIISKTGFSKVKVSRLVDRLEQKGLVERKRRGMTNLVVVK